ncbi:hypothetical protein [Xanthomonas campestris]|uniref:hypothetical protein n=1 Tax=Xanthomonas campestris TaxID=339 RepID=UPI001E311FEA|nr:hypothetical protein [Xanthomonas campestris]MCC4603526.1 hypothetical protein [Xanthomonas campestris pv. parthenii]
MKILFWNTLRLGSGTTGDKAVLAEGVLAEAFNVGAEFAVLCEVTSKATLGDALIDKALVMARRGKKKQSSQLGYAAVDNELSAAAGSAYEPPSFHDVFGFSAYKKGGCSFAKHTKRHVARLDDVGDGNKRVRVIYQHHLDEALGRPRGRVVAQRPSIASICV